MKPSRTKTWRQRARKRGLMGGSFEEMLSIGAGIAGVVGGIGVAAHSVGPELANQFHDRISHIAEEPGSSSGSGNGGLDFGMFQSAAESAFEAAGSAASWAQQQQNQKNEEPGKP